MENNMAKDKKGTNKPKTKEELAAELKQKALQNYLEDVEKVNAKHNMRLVPVIQYTPKGAMPMFNVEETEPVDVKWTKADGNKPKTNKSADTDDKGAKD